MFEVFPVVLTTEDFALLESIADLTAEPFPGAIEVVRRKLASASVVFPADIDDDVVTLNSRVRFSANNGPVDERVLVGGAIEDVYDRTLSLTSPRGLALIGASVGQTVAAQRRDGWVERLRIEAVPFQLEHKLARPSLRIVSQGEVPTAPVSIQRPSRSNTRIPRWSGDDDPGPSAA